MNKYDILVIGGGSAGLVAAIEVKFFNLTSLTQFYLAFHQLFGDT